MDLDSTKQRSHCESIPVHCNTRSSWRNQPFEVALMFGFVEKRYEFLTFSPPALAFETKLLISSIAIGSPVKTQDTTRREFSKFN
jgi:hypothetical protein